MNISINHLFCAASDIVSLQMEQGYSFDDIDFKSIAQGISRIYQQFIPAEDYDLLVLNIQKELKRRFSVSVTSSHTILGESQENWLTQERKESIFKNGFWVAYAKYLALDRSSKEIARINESTDDILGLLADPKLGSPQQKKGLVIGDVQSGKTSNYAGLMCKAADAGYKLIIVISGILDSLRSQTQERLERDFVGKSSNDAIAKEYINKKYGVAEFRSEKVLQPILLTSSQYDFKNVNAANIAPDLVQGNIALLVIKKNSRILSSVLSFFRKRISDEQRAKIPVLVIDDEADNASPNTKKESNPSAINKKIRELLSLFPVNSYVGYTATPYANIFINPYLTGNPVDSIDKMQNQDLFPRDFITCLGHSSEYIGATRLFCSDEEDNAEYNPLKWVIQTIDDAEDFSYQLKHGCPSCMPDSLIEAINTFILTKAIRSIREDREHHCSMLIHVTMIRNGHTILKDLVERYKRSLIASIKAYIGLYKPENQNLLLQGLYQTWLNQFANTDIDETWEDVCQAMKKSEFTQKINVYKENSDTDKKLRLDYSQDKSLAAIVIGGNSLARGLTLEGLTTSYFLRDSKQYDTLMQMGRWFGYRPQYGEICRLFLTEHMQNNFAAIAQATDELKASVEEMRNEGKSPLEFGLRVRNGIGGLLVTARNKMKSAVTREEWVDFSDSLCETYKISALPDVISKNKAHMLEFINKLNLKYEQHTPSPDEESYGIIWEGVSIHDVIAFLKSTKEMYFSADPKAHSTLEETLRQLSDIDVALIVSKKQSRNGVVTTYKYWDIEHSIPWRVPRVRDDYYYFAKNHPFDRIHELGFMKKDQIEGFKKEYAARLIEQGKQRTTPITTGDIPGFYYRRAETRRPLMMIALMAVPNEENSKRYANWRKSGREKPTSEIFTNQVAVYGFSFPKSVKGGSGRVRFTVNPVQIYQEQRGQSIPEEEEDEY